MEKVLDTSLRPDHTTTGIYDPVTAEKPILTRCCSITHQLSSLTAKLRGCKGDQSTQSPGRDDPTVAVGTGVYFQSLSSSPSIDPDCSTSDIQNLFKLATVACEVESSIRNRQLVKKRRTPRKVLWINASSGITYGNCKNRIPAARASEVAKRHRAGNLLAGHYTQPSWLVESVKDTTTFTSKRTCTNIANSSNKVILKFGSQHGTVRKKIMACSPKSSGIKFKKVSSGNNIVSSIQSKSRARRLPGKDTRVQGVAKRILQFVGNGSTAEKFIRGAFGNNPDTSKALRLLLAQQKVCRIGDGGRGNAFIYVATTAGLRELEDLKNHHVITTNMDDNSTKSHPPIQNQDGLQMSLKDSVSPLTNAHNGVLAPRYAFRDVSNCLSEVKMSQNALHNTILGNNKE